MSHERIAAQLYQSLKAMPCRCQKQWQANKSAMVTTLQCSRCLAVNAYETMMVEQETINA